MQQRQMNRAAWQSRAFRQRRSGTLAERTLSASEFDIDVGAQAAQLDGPDSAVLGSPPLWRVHLCQGGRGGQQRWFCVKVERGGLEEAELLTRPVQRRQPSANLLPWFGRICGVAPSFAEPALRLPGSQA